MKTFLFTSLMFIVLINISHAQSGWFVSSSGHAGLHSVYFTGTNTGYVVGNFGDILKTTNAGSNWSNLISGTDFVLRGVIFTDVNTGYVSGAIWNNNDTGMVMKTTNAGLNWFALDLPVYTHRVCVDFPSSDTGYSVGQGVILKTTDAGNSWITQYPPSPAPPDYFMAFVKFINVNTGYIVGNFGGIIRTTNGGANWIQQGSGTTEPLWGIDFINENTGVICGGYSTTSNIILRTTNGGTDWNSITVYPHSSCLFWSVKFVNANTGWIAGWCGNILKTTDAGITWCNQDPVSSENFRTTYFTSDNTGFLVSDQGNIKKTTDGGGECVQSGINTLSTEIPSAFQLSQNYPNPFNPTTMIKFDLPKSSMAKLVVFDILGKEVTTLVNEQLKAGTYEVNWNASDFQSGVYFFELKTPEFNQTKRMVLLK